MARITLQLDVKNVSEIVQDRKGKIVSWVAHQIKGEAALKEEIEKMICDEIVTGLRSQLDARFKDEGILASLRVRVEP